jgi:tRNA A-37 threonylcarbamoyl transferase component Bud32
MIDVISGSAARDVLASLKVDWTNGVLTAGYERILPHLLENSLANMEAHQVVLSPTGLALLGRLLVDLPSLAKSKEALAGRYRLKSIIAQGKNSVTFRAVHEAINRQAVLKIVRPGAAANLAEALARIGKARGEPFLVHPIDYFQVPYRSVLNDPLQLDCIVYPFVSGRTLAAFLRDGLPLSPSFVPAYMMQLAEALAALEEVGAYHGDLHAGNIIVTHEQPGHLEFRVIDVSFGVGHTSKYTSDLTDLQHYQLQVRRLLTALQRQFPTMSAKKNLGARWFTLVERVLSPDKLTFQQILALGRREAPFKEYQSARERFLSERFVQPQVFGLLRYEEITDPLQAARLFEPYPELFRLLKQFGSAVIEGPRGCGKSTYLASLAYFPGLRERRLEPTEVFGVYIPCRQGEFRQFALVGTEARFSPVVAQRVKHIFVLKIARRCVRLLAEAVAKQDFRKPSDYQPLFSFFEARAGLTQQSAFDSTIELPLDDLHDVIMRAEVKAVDRLFSHRPAKAKGGLLDEPALVEFCKCVRRVFPELVRTRFYFLFDDAGTPNVPRPAQRVINDFIRASNEVYCVKLSTERFGHYPVDSGGKVLEDGPDYNIFDLSKQFGFGSGIDPERRKIEGHFSRIIHNRLKTWSYSSHDVVGYLGDEPIPLGDLVGRLAESGRDAYYCGWEHVWQIADRNPRTLIELVSEILLKAGIQPSSPARVVEPRTQSAAIEAVSERKLRALTYIPGQVRVYGIRRPLGRHLNEFATAFGQIARTYLTKRPPRADVQNRRYDEKLGLERNDGMSLRPESKVILEQLIRFAVLDDSKMETSQDDQIKKPVYVLNRVLCPVFRISFRRQTNLKLSRDRLETLLLQPAAAARSTTAFLRKQGRDQHGLPL